RQGRPVRRAPRLPAARGRARGRGGRPRRPRRRRGDAPPAVLRLRDHEAPLLRRRRARGRLRRAGDGPQPGRRGGAAHGQRAPLADGPPRAPAAGAAGDPSQVRAQGAGEGIPRGRGRARVSAAPERAAAGERATLRAEEAVVLIDRKERTYLRVLRPGRSISVRGAPLPCDALIGLAEGSTVETTAG